MAMRQVDPTAMVSPRFTERCPNPHLTSHKVNPRMDRRLMKMVSDVTGLCHGLNHALNPTGAASHSLQPHSPASVSSSAYLL
ncbi:Uncharacterized protein DAT39_008122 [Clarias magur]|uniref:Uncharacterized protein n=1 Tax=Clarias magur TaxID=1594786 RepID=A0A8J4U1S0_CLAMG|nr:Uncharacterized protein DAT39_008122 [Clarias magur]